MVTTVRNDIEMVPTTTPEGMKVKDVNLKQEARPGRRRSRRCIITVGLATVVLLSLAVGSVFLFEYMLGGIPTENGGDGSPSSTIAPEIASVQHQSVPAFADPFDGTSGQQREITSIMPTEDDDEIDIDEAPSTSSEVQLTDGESINEDSSDVSRSDDDTEAEYQYSSGSGSGDGGDMSW